MKNDPSPHSRTSIRRRTLTPVFLLTLSVLSLTPRQAHASFLHGAALDTLADVISWVAIVLAPIVGIGIFWMVHIIPEKVAEKKKHPQAKAIQVLCLLSLFFGGLLWPLAWLWAYSKPVLHKLAYGTDTHDEHTASGAEAAKGGRA